MSETSKCCTCGYAWITGQDSYHSCVNELETTIKTLQQEKESLVRENDELKACAEELVYASKLSTNYPSGWDSHDSEHFMVINRLNAAVDQTPKQSLATHNAEVINRFAHEMGLYDSEYDDNEYIEVSRYSVKNYINQLREEGSNG